MLRRRLILRRFRLRLLRLSMMRALMSMLAAIAYDVTTAMPLRLRFFAMPRCRATAAFDAMP